jgi:hypothetical protein
VRPFAGGIAGRIQASTVELLLEHQPGMLA